MSSYKNAFLSKLKVPDTAGAIPRERLFREIACSAPVVWVAAPPGTGKTTLAASFLAFSKRPALWYRIDGGDADLAGFFYFLGLAVAKAAPRRRAAMPLLTPEYLPDLPGFSRRFFREMFRRLPSHSLVAFDNYHELDSHPVFHDIMRVGLEEIPDGIQVVVLSRTEPPPALSRFVANRRLHHIGWEMLRLTSEETHVLAGVDQATAERLHVQSDGWAAGVILLLRHAGDPSDVASRLHSQLAVFNYFAGEIFDRMPEDIRRMLVSTAFLPDFSAATAARLGGHADAEKALETLCHQHCFIERAGGLVGRYRYHDLFRDFLQSQAGARSCDYRRDAAQALADESRMGEAIPLLLENSDWQASAGLILNLAQDLVVQGRWKTLADWIDALPEDLHGAMPWLLFWRGMAELPVRPAAARILIERAYERFTATNDIMGRLLSAAAVIEANFYEWADFSLLDEWIDVLESLGGIDAAYPSHEVEGRVLTGMLMAIGHRRPAYDKVQILADRLEALLNQDIDANLKSVIAAFHLWHAYWIGDFAQARRVHAIARQLLAVPRMTPLNKIMLLCMIGQGEVFLGDGIGSREVYERASAIAQEYGLVFARGCYVMPLQAYCHISFGDLERAEQTMAEIDSMPFSGAINASQQMFSKSWLALRRGNVRLARDHIRAANELAEKSGSVVARAWSQAGWAQILVAAGDYGSARQHVDIAWRIVEGKVSGLLPHHLGLVEAWLALRSGDHATCCLLLRDALAYASAHDLGNNLYWLPEMMSELCVEALRAGIETDYVCRLIRKRKLHPLAEEVEAWPWPLRIRTLGRFEVLREGRPIEFSRKTPKKPIALLKALVAMGGQDVPESRLIDALWPDSEADDAAEVLAVNIHRLRKLLGLPEAIRLEGGRVGLNPDICQVDVWSFERLTEQTRKVALMGRHAESLDIAQGAVAMYRGNFLAGEPEEPWMLTMRERVRTRFVNHIKTVAGLLCERKECQQVIDACRRGLEADDLVETFYQELMRCHHCQGRNAEGLAVYRRMRQTFSVVLGIAPSAASESLHSKLRGT